MLRSFAGRRIVRTSSSVAVNHGHVYVAVVAIALISATMSCAFLSSPATLNDGKGTRASPVPARVYAHTPDYDVRALSVVWPETNDVASADAQMLSLRVQYQIQCGKQDDEACNLKEIGNTIKLVDESGIIYDPIVTVGLEKPLEGEILGGGEQAGWLSYSIPRGVTITSALAEYGQDQRVFFELP